jgi:hypothetical protein
MTLWRFGSWYAKDVITLNHLAIYVILPEIILGITSYLGYLDYDKHSKSKILHTFLITFLIMLLYVINLSISYFLVEKIIFT